MPRINISKPSILKIERGLAEELKRLEQENKSLYEEKNCLHKIIDRLLENAGYSKDIASAEDFEDAYEDMQIKRNELIELEQENKQMKSALEEIKELLNLGVCNNGVNGNCRPIRNTKKEDCYNAIYKVKDLVNEVLG